jgi:DNA invertase Pin-like site-specific DNA recombinase
VPVLVKNIKTGKTSEYLTMTEAAKACSVSRTTIKNILQSGKILRESYIITFKN